LSDAPIGTQGLPRDGVPALGDINVSMGGGAQFMARLQQLMDAREQSEQAFASLQLGEDIASARSDAERKLAAAEQAKVDADAVLAKAKADAAQVKSASDTYAAKVKSDADAYAADVRKSADAVLVSAKGELAAAQKAQSDAELMHRRSEAAKVVAESSTRDAKALQARLQSKIDRLHQFVDQELSAMDAAKRVTS
jgi:redox-sensitive bicupin YhaK (pirin superfamily)